MTWRRSDTCNSSSCGTLRTNLKSQTTAQWRKAIPITVALVAHKAPPFLGLLLFDSLHPPIVHPFPNISQHVQMTKSSWGEGSDRTGAFKPVLSSVGGWKLSLPGVCPMLAPRLPLVAPRVEPILLARPARSLPLSLAWQSLASPTATKTCSFIRNRGMTCNRLARHSS